jgi:hypothetical protein
VAIEDFVQRFWGVILALVTFVVWLARLEQKSVAMQRDIDRLWRQREEDMSASKDARANLVATMTAVQVDVAELKTASRLSDQRIGHILEGINRIEQRFEESAK